MNMITSPKQDSFTNVFYGFISFSISSIPT